MKTFTTNQDLTELMLQENECVKEEGGAFTDVEELDIKDISFAAWLMERVRHQAEDQEKVQALMSAIASGQSLPPLVVDKRNYLIDGFHRLQAALNLNLSSVPVIRYTDAVPDFIPMR